MRTCQLICSNRPPRTAQAPGDAAGRSASTWTSKAIAKQELSNYPDITGPGRNHAALFFPRLKQPNPLRDNQSRGFVPCGALAGVFAAHRHATRRVESAGGPGCRPSGVCRNWRALTDDENGELNPLGINCLRLSRHRPRGLGRAHAAGRRRSRQSGSTSPSGARRCSSRRASTAARNGWCSNPTTNRCGRRSGSTSAPSCTTCFARAPSRARRRARPISSSATRRRRPRTTSTWASSISLVGFAPLKPAEFVIIKIQQIAGQIAGLRQE